MDKEKDYGQLFQNEDEAEQEAFALLDRYLAVYAGRKSQADTPEPNEVERERNLLCQARDAFWERHRATCEKQPTRLDFLIERAGMDVLKLLTFLLAFAPEWDMRYGEDFAKLQSGRRTRACLGLAAALARLTGDAPRSAVALLLDKRAPFHYLFRGLYDGEGEDVGMEEMLILKSRVLRFLYGGVFPADGIGSYSELSDGVKEEICIYQEEYGQLNLSYRNMLAAEPHGLIMLTGAAHSGRHFLMRRLGGEWEKNVLFIHLDRMMAQAKMDEFISDIQLERLLAAQLLVFDGIDALYREGSLPEQAVRALQLLMESDGYFFFLCNEKLPIDCLTKIPFVEIPLHRPTPSEKNKLWSFFGRDMSFAEDVDFTSFGSQYVLSPAEIPGVLATASIIGFMRTGTADAPIGLEHIVEAVKQHDRQSLSSVAAKIPCVFTWDDLILPERTMRQLKIICNQVKYRSTVADEWGFYKKTPYGRGIYALFYGSPGTGKTMAVQVIAREMGLELFRIDLSSVVSKYIGETEKNITELFDRAKEVNALLFFDEADALFAKRSAGNSSNDRNANAETAHLLQKMEEYEGVAILATNLRTNIDPAFSRRIKFMVHFDRPDEETRRLLWNKVFPAQVPLDKDVDLDRYARTVDLSGSAIKEVAFYAAHLAAAEKVPVCHRHIMEALKANAEKDGRIFDFTG